MAILPYTAMPDNPIQQYQAVYAEGVRRVCHRVISASVSAAGGGWHYQTPTSH
jgi:hypothetical protein